MQIIYFGKYDEVTQKFYQTIKNQINIFDCFDDIKDIEDRTQESYYDLIIIDSEMINKYHKLALPDLKNQIQSHMLIYFYIRTNDLKHMKQYIRCFHDGMIFEYYTKQRQQDILIQITSFAYNLQKKILSDLFVQIITLRDIETNEHLLNVAHYTTLLAKGLRELGIYHFLSDRFIEDLYFAAHFHDIGKIGISDDILFKPGKYSQEEYNKMKLHTTYGDKIFTKLIHNQQRYRYVIMAKHIAKYHHEKWNGHGYPSQLHRKEIPLVARIVALADVYDALCSQRPYKDAYTHEEAKQIIINERGQHFDPDVVDAFLLMEHYFIKYKQSHYLGQ